MNGRRCSNRSKKRFQRLQQRRNIRDALGNRDQLTSVDELSVVRSQYLYMKPVPFSNDDLDSLVIYDTNKATNCVRYIHGGCK